MGGLHRLQLPKVVHFDSVAVVERASSELHRVRLVALAKDAVHSLSVEGDAGGGFGVDAYAHVGEVVDRVNPLADIRPHLVPELFIAIADFEGDVGVDIRCHARLEKFLAGLVDGQESAVARIGDGVAITQGRAGELSGKGRAVLNHGFGGSVGKMGFDVFDVFDIEELLMLLATAGHIRLLFYSHSGQTEHKKPLWTPSRTHSISVVSALAY